MIIGTTGPTVFNEEIKSLVQDYYKSTPLYINQDGAENLDWVLDNINGLILSGGRDISPIIYDEEITNGDSLSNFDLLRDKREMYLIEGCFKRNIAVMGLCRGLQILSIYHGLKSVFMKDINGSSVCHAPNKSGIELDGLPCHKVYCLDKHKEEFFDVEYCNSFHHQSVWFFDTPKGLDFYTNHGIEVLAYAHLEYKDNGNKRADKKIVELMKGINNRWIAAQWHPESSPNDKVNKIVLDKFKDMLPKI